MLDIRQFRENPDLIRERLATRGEEFAAKVDDVVRLDAERREAITAVEELKARRNAASKEIGTLMGQKKIEEAEAKKAEVRDIGDQISELDAKAGQVDTDLRDILLRLPNLPHADVPVGASEEDNTEISQWGEKPSFDFEPKPHTEICESLGLVDFARGAKLSGSGFLLYSGWGARLERALIQYLLDMHVHEHGYTEVSPPFMVGYDCMIGVGQFPKFEDQAYMVQEGLDEESRGKLYLIPTAEAPVANIHREEILKKSCSENKQERRMREMFVPAHRIVGFSSPFLFAHATRRRARRRSTKARFLAPTGFAISNRTQCSVFSVSASESLRLATRFSNHT